MSGPGNDGAGHGKRPIDAGELARQIENLEAELVGKAENAIAAGVLEREVVLVSMLKAYAAVAAKLAKHEARRNAACFAVTNVTGYVNLARQKHLGVI